jgi:hypothetical protein
MFQRLALFQFITPDVRNNGKSQTYQSNSMMPYVCYGDGILGNRVPSTVMQLITQKNFTATNVSMIMNNTQ